MDLRDPLVISGAGVVTYGAASLDALIDDVRAGRRRPLHRFAEAAEHGCRCTRYGAATPDLSDEALGLDRRDARFMGRGSRLALRAARDALAEAGLASTADLAVVVGSGAGDTATHRDVQERLEATRSARRVGPTVIPKLMASTVSANLANALRARGPAASVAAACAGGAYNLAFAASMVRDGLCDAALAGGVEILDLHFHAGFDAMRAYCADEDGTELTASRPYAADRAGFVFGEGAGVLVVERRSRALARGATPLAVLCAVGLGADGDGEMVQPSTEGAARVMRTALRLAGIGPSDVGYVNTHATSTPAGDVAEARAVLEVFGPDVAYASTKGFTGHTISAAGAIEAAVTARALALGAALPCAPIEALDPALSDSPPVLAERPLAAAFALSNSFGFGGTNASVVLARPDA
jgi:3-oxoacyl-[acyl-carrier-protein] synthase-1